MRLTATLVSLLTVLCFSSTSTANEQPNENGFRVPLQRKSLLTHPHSDHNPRLASGYDNAEFLKAHTAWVAAKYRASLASYQANTGSPHPLALAISATTTGTLVAGQKLTELGTSSPIGKLAKRRRKQDAALGVAHGNPTLPDRNLQSRYTKRNINGINLTEVNSNMWMGSISVGTPPQNFTVDFDTGSADLFLPNKTCNSTCDGHTRYDPTASTTSIDLGITFESVYSGGSSVSGTQYADNVYMGGYEAVNQTFGAATTYSSDLQSPTFIPDGLLGMAFSSISVLGTSPVFQTMVSAGVVQQAVFGFALSSQPGQSELTIGGTNTAMYQTSTVEYVSVSLQSYWQIPFAGLTRPGLNNTPDVVVVNETSYAQSIIDTGTTLIITSDSNAQTFYANVTSARQIGGGLWSVPCDTVGSLAPTLTFGSRSFPVSPATFNLGPVSDGSTDCVAGLGGGGSPYWIIGDVFLQNVYTIFDVANTRVGFADLA